MSIEQIYTQSDEPAHATDHVAFLLDVADLMAAHDLSIKDFENIVLGGALGGVNDLAIGVILGRWEAT